MRVDAGQSMPGRAPGMAMEVSSSGTSDLNVLVMFVVDATKTVLDAFCLLIGREHCSRGAATVKISEFSSASFVTLASRSD